MLIDIEELEEAIKRTERVWFDDECTELESYDFGDQEMRQIVDAAKAYLAIRLGKNNGQ